MLIRKRRVHTEVYNDLDGEIVNVFRILRDPEQADSLIRLLSLTPYARQEYEACYQPSEDPVEQARRTIVRAHMGYSSVGATSRSGFRSGSSFSGASTARDWARLPIDLWGVMDRLKGVLLENRPAVEVMMRYDAKHTLHYVDPPYLPSTRNTVRGNQGVYRHEMDEDDHRKLAAVLHQLKGIVVVSGYPSPLYDEELFAGWQRFTRAARADSGAQRTEVLWISPQAVVQPSLGLAEDM